MKSPRFSPAWMIVLAKAGKLVALLKLVKVTKVLVTATSMLISMLAYDLIFDPWFSLGLVLMLFVHEMGHVIAMRRMGMGTPAPVFIPFLGAAIFVKDFSDRVTEAFIGYGGPFLGTFATLLCLAAWWITDSHLLLAVSFIGAYLNLFNMIPIRPLDGGRITQVIGENFKYFGFLALIAFTVYTGEPSLIIIWLLVMMDIRMPRWWRPVIGILLAMTMTTMFSLGYGERSLIMDTVDIVIAGLFVAAFVLFDWKRQPDVAVERQPYPLWPVRLKWLGLYLALTIGLWGVLWYVMDQLPPPA